MSFEEILIAVAEGAGLLKTFARCLIGSGTGWAVASPARAFAGAFIPEVTTK